MWLKSVLFLIYLVTKVDGYLELSTENNLFDNELYESVLDPELCAKDLQYLKRNNTLLLLTFLDAGFRIPRGILQGNTQDYGNYFECLKINKKYDNTEIQGKYCTIEVKLSGSSQTQTFWAENDLTKLVTNEVLEKIQSDLKKANSFAKSLNVVSPKDSQDLFLYQAICIPAHCSVEQALPALFPTFPAIFEYTPDFCRLPNDKPWLPGNYVAIAIFSLIALLNLLGTSYDVIYKMLFKKDPKNRNKYLVMWSVYSNAQKLVTFKSNAGSIDSLDGIRSIAMAWVILGHCFVGEAINLIEVNEWAISVKSLHITAAPITVDTFFFLGGVLLVYTMVGRVSGGQFLKKLHLFYLNRLIRLLPMLATAVLLQATLWHHFLDGPMWPDVMGKNVQRCREFWWSTLLHIQNYVNPYDQCINHSWYLAIDLQVYIVSPLVVYWLLINKRSRAWLALTCGLIVSVEAATVFSFLMEFPGLSIALARSPELEWYMVRYYKNTLTRTPPFFVGMVFGYILHINKGRKLEISKYLVAFFWLFSVAVAFLIFYIPYRIIQLDWDNQTVDSLVNSFMRPVWSMAVGWVVLACVHGYSGPINWFLSLHMWKILARLSYAMFIFHYPIIDQLNATKVTRPYFTVLGLWLDFITLYSISFVIGAVATVTIDYPVASLLTAMIGGGIKKKKPEESHLREEKEMPSTSNTNNNNSNRVNS